MTAAERKWKRVAALERLNEKQAAEIERLRTAMVLAMADCEAAADHNGNPVSTKSTLRGVAMRLQAELVRK